MSQVPARLYGADMASNYQGQGLKLSKHFAAP
jgi:dCTP deaminase